MLDETWAPLGEVSKYVPLSSKRVLGVTRRPPTAASDVDWLDIRVAGVAGENVRMCAVRLEGGKLPKASEMLCAATTFNEDGRKTISIHG